MAVNTAPVKWAQRADSIYLTLDLPDVKDEQLKLTKDMLSFRQVSISFSSAVLLRGCLLCPWGEREGDGESRTGLHEDEQHALQSHAARIRYYPARFVVGVAAMGDGS